MVNAVTATHTCIATAPCFPLGVALSQDLTSLHTTAVNNSTDLKGKMMPNTIENIYLKLKYFSKIRMNTVKLGGLIQFVQNKCPVAVYCNLKHLLLQLHTLPACAFNSC